jgi:hypothetical protein
VESQLKTVMVALLAPGFGFMVDKWGLSAAMGALAILTFIIYPFLRLRRQVEKP